ncbi:hypothetical protein IW142_001530 [Coemansia sp. RSA 564]|nr:hypothetical protein IW142_001530 [Coemansia sp. RSA 564]KAJ2409224.1 hypothetical protein J3F80_001481 [Coemansia sp. RSA 2526]
MSSNRRSRSARPPQTSQPPSESLAQDSADLDRPLQRDLRTSGMTIDEMFEDANFWHTRLERSANDSSTGDARFRRVLAAQRSRIGGDSPDNPVQPPYFASSAERLANRREEFANIIAHPPNESSRRRISRELRRHLERNRSGVQHVNGWTIVDPQPWDVSRPGDSPQPRSRRRRLGESPMDTTPLPVVDNTGWNSPSAQSDDDVGIDIGIDEAPRAQGPVLLFDTDDVDDDTGVLDDVDDDTGIPEGGDFDDWFVRTFRNNIMHQVVNPRMLAARRHRAALVPQSKRGGPGASVVVRQAWNAAQPWRPYVYQPPITMPGEAPPDTPENTSDVAHARFYSVHAAIGALPVRCTNSDDPSAFHHALTPSSALFRTAQATNVHVELRLDGGRHSVVERILIMSSMASPPCTELMVFASSRRCDLAELRKYDNFTFAEYERLSQEVAAGRAPPLDPLPIAYFWLSLEEEYEQMQVLPEGVHCSYLYLKLLRGPTAAPRMSLRLVRIFGWNGPRSFSEAAIC